MNTARLLLVEDDVVSAQFLGDVLESLPATLVHAGSCAQALAAARDARFDLWLVDANLPDGTAEGLLAGLRHAHPVLPPALALTADPFEERRQRLLAAGFLAVLAKPIQAGRLLDTLRAHLGPGASVPASDGEHERVELWDEAGALLAAGGRAESVAALRMLFARELPLDRDRVLQALATGAWDELHDTLHRLKASCGFVGARRLLETVQAFSRAPEDPAHRARFEDACRSTLAGL